MNLFSLSNQRGSAPVARERLQVLLAHEHTAADRSDLVAIAGRSDLVATLREEILAVIAKQLGLQRHKVLVKIDRGETISQLEINLEIPTLSGDRVASMPEPLAQAAA